MNHMTQVVDNYIARHLQTVQTLRDTLQPQIATVAAGIVTALKAGNKVLIMGNGGSAADAQHFAAELVGRFRRERQGLPAIALSTDSSILTAIGNDYGFDAVFSRQVEALAAAGDVVIGISTSGNSQNVLAAIERAAACGCSTIGLLGMDGGRLAAAVDSALVVSAGQTSLVQEAHIMVIHLLCELVEAAMSAEGERA